jgi:hypothetical protein
LAAPLKIVADEREIMDVPVDEFGFLFRRRVVAGVEAVKVSVRARGETDLGAIVVGAAFAVILVTKVSAEVRIGRRVAEATAGAQFVAVEIGIEKVSM